MNLNQNIGFELDKRYQYFRELLKNFSEREESLKEKLVNRDNFLKSIGIFQKMEQENPMLDSI